MVSGVNEVTARVVSSTLWHSSTYYYYYCKGSNEIVPTSARTPMSPPSDVGNVLFWMSTVLARVIFGYFGCQPCPIVLFPI